MAQNYSYFGFFISQFLFLHTNNNTDYETKRGRRYDEWGCRYQLLRGTSMTGARAVVASISETRRAAKTPSLPARICEWLDADPV